MVRNWTAAHEKRLASPEADPKMGRRVTENRTTILRALHEGGVAILMGTDAPQQFSVPGFALHREFPRMAAAGMSPWDILVSGTRNVGLYFANEDQFGMVAPKHRADLILVDADPLEDSANLQKLAGVMVRGRWIPKSEIDRGLEEIAKRVSSTE
jgi:imidazolonepropionase-like amidohydrolase